MKTLKKIDKYQRRKIHYHFYCFLILIKTITSLNFLYFCNNLYEMQGAPDSVRVGWVPTGSGSYRFRFKKIQKNEKISFSVFFSSGMGSGPSRVAPWTPWINIKIHLFVIFLIFLIFFHCFAINDHLTL